MTSGACRGIQARRPGGISFKDRSPFEAAMSATGGRTLVTALVLAALLAGCSDRGVAPDPPGPAAPGDVWVRQGVQCEPLPWSEASGVLPPPDGGRPGSAPEMTEHYLAQGVEVVASGRYAVPDGGAGALCGNTDNRVYWIKTTSPLPDVLNWTSWQGVHWWWRVQLLCQDEPWQEGGPVADDGSPVGLQDGEAGRLAEYLVESKRPAAGVVVYRLEPQGVQECGNRGPWRYWAQTDAAWPLGDGWLPIPVDPPY